MSMRTLALSLTLLVGSAGAAAARCFGEGGGVPSPEAGAVLGALLTSAVIYMTRKQPARQAN
jgi:hypothetical protein